MPASGLSAMFRSVKRRLTPGLRIEARTPLRHWPPSARGGPFLRAVGPPRRLRRQAPQPFPGSDRRSGATLPACIDRRQQPGAVAKKKPPQTGRERRLSFCGVRFLPALRGTGGVAGGFGVHRRRWRGFPMESRLSRSEVALGGFCSPAAIEGEGARGTAAGTVWTPGTIQRFQERISFLERSRESDGGA